MRRKEPVDVRELNISKKGDLFTEINIMLTQWRLSTVAKRFANEISRSSEKFSFDEYLSEDKDFKNFVYSNRGMLTHELNFAIEESETFMAEWPEHVAYTWIHAQDKILDTQMIQKIRKEAKNIRIYNHALLYIKKVEDEFKPPAS